MAKKFVTVELDDGGLGKQLKAALKRNPEATGRTITAIALDLAGESASRAPIESGDLRNNCHAEINGTTVFENQVPALGGISTLAPIATIGYSLPYALRQHEELDYRHDRTDGYRRDNGSTVNLVAGGEAKFLEKPFEERKQTYIDTIMKIPDEVLK